MAAEHDVGPARIDPDAPIATSLVAQEAGQWQLWRLILAPEEYSPWHIHEHPYTFMVVSDGPARAEFEDPSKEPEDQHDSTGVMAYCEPDSGHRLGNPGREPYVNYIVVHLTEGVSEEDARRQAVEVLVTCRTTPALPAEQCAEIDAFLAALARNRARECGSTPTSLLENSGAAPLGAGASDAPGRATSAAPPAGEVAAAVVAPSRQPGRRTERR